MPRLTNKAKLKQQIALRLLIDLKALHLAFQTPWSEISDAFKITSTTLTDKNLEIKSALPLLKTKHKKVFAKSQGITLFKSRFGTWLKEHFSLSETAYQIIFVTHLINNTPQLKYFANSICEINDCEYYEMLATLLQCSAQKIAHEFDIGSPIIKHKLMSICSESNDFTNKAKINNLIEMQLFNPFFKPKNMLSSYLSPVEKPILELASYRRISRDVNWVMSILKQYRKTPYNGCNILLYGEPGTGKTELSRVLADEAKLHCLEVNFAHSNGKQLTGEERLNKLALAQNFIQKKGNIIVFDELEDAIPNNFPFSSHDGPKKRWFNELLENNPAPVIWISNEIDQIDPAFLRRFDYCLKVNHPTNAYKKKMISYMLEVDKDQPWVEEMANNKQITAADITRAAGVVMTSEITSDKQKEHYFNNILSTRGASTKKYRNKNKGQYISETEYSPQFSNTSMPLSEVTDIVERSEEGRFLFHGVPGTGKTGYVHYLAKSMNKELVSKSASNLLGMYVGENEKAIRSMFAEAKHKNAILLLDEADSFFSDRAEHNSEWRSSMVNEMLVQLEQFQGIFFASTNLPEKLDTAIKRRFDFHIAFDYLNPEQVRDMIIEYSSDASEVSLSDLNHLDNITPADFSVAARQSRLKGESITLTNLLALLAEQSSSRLSTKQRVGFL